MEELPESLDMFERDFAYDVETRTNMVKFKCIVATTKSFPEMYKRGTMYQKMQANKWFVNLIRLETQGNTANLGYLLNAHNRWHQ